MLTKMDKCIIIIRYYKIALIKTETNYPFHRESQVVRCDGGRLSYSLLSIRAKYQ